MLYYFSPIFVVCFVIFGLVTWWYYEFIKFGRYCTKYKGPTPVPVIGSAYMFSSTTDIIPVIMDLHKKYGPVFKLWLGYRPRIVISDYKAAELLLGSTTILDKSYDYNFFHPWLGTGLLTSTGAKWKRQRKLLTPAFHFQILEQFISVFSSQSDVLIRKLRAAVDNGPVDIYPYINLCALDTISEAAMGIQINAQEDTDSDYVHSVAEITRIIIARSMSVLKTFDILYKFSKDYYKQNKALSYLHGQTNYVINSRSEKISNQHNKDTHEDTFGIKKRKAFLDLLLQCRVGGSPLPKENIREEVDTFMFEGHDTVTSGLSFTLYCLSQNRIVQEEVVDELRGIFQNDKHRTATYQDLQDMKYLEMVLKESMRLYPPVPLFARTVVEDTEFDGTVFPKGTTLTLIAYALHRQEEIFPDPETFDPQRFSAKSSVNRPPFAHVPFSAGPRNCIGQRFAMLEMKSVISKILRNFELLPVVGFTPELSADAILRSANGILVSFKDRQF